MELGREGRERIGHAQLAQTPRMFNTRWMTKLRCLGLSYIYKKNFYWADLFELSQWDQVLICDCSLEV